jgi:uncharacterized protein YbaP (TraB family)
MRRQIIVMFYGLLFLSTPGGLTQAQPAAPAAAGHQKLPTLRGALFRVGQGSHTLYLFGTIHVGAPDFYPLEPRLSAALEHASTLALEIDPEGDPVQMAKAVRTYGLYAPGGTAAAQIRPEFRPRLQALLKQYGIAPESVAPMKPWLLASVLSISEFGACGYQSSLAVDTYLARQAHQRKIPVLELESASAQMALFDRMAAGEQAHFLEESITAIEDKEQAAQAKAIADAWRTADSAALDKLAQDAAADTSFSGRFLQKVLLEERNPGLADGIARLLARQDHAVAAIGVLHLVGNGSVPQLLRERGLKVERIY